MELTISKEDLYKDYVEVGMSTRDIAEKYSSSQSQVRRMMKYYGIPTRDNKVRTDYHNNKMQPYWDELKVTNRKWHTKVCEWCNKEFEIDYTTKNNKFCSPECRKQHQLQSKKKQKYYCKQCGKEITYKDRVYPRKYCDDCYISARSKNQSKRITTYCAYCGKELSIIPALYKKHKNHHCDKICMAKYYSEHYAGENSPAWKGGKKHYAGKWFDARDNARERDKFTCQRCGITEDEYGKELSVHHIKSYKSFEDKIEANELDNLICLCEPCHRFVHSNSNKENLFIDRNSFIV